LIFYLLGALAIALSVAYGLVYWAYRAETDRSARVGLYLVYGLPGVLLVVAGLALTVYSRESGPLLLAAGLGLTLPLVKPFRVQMARLIPIDPNSPTDMSGLSLLLCVIGVLIAATWHSQEPSSDNSAVEYSQLVVQLLAWILLSYIIVGTRLRRTVPQANERLGLRRPTLTIIAISVGFLVIALMVNGFAGTLTAIFQPHTSDAIQSSLDEMTGDLQSPFGALLIGVSAGIGEELFFRGALQPKFGIVLTALCFALLHTNYGFSFVTLGVFGMGVVFGLQRKRYGTISPMITHGLVNLIAVLIQTYS
jgi:membrane protease YdiL (CAAX protease family)